MFNADVLRPFNPRDPLDVYADVPTQTEPVANPSPTSTIIPAPSRQDPPRPRKLPVQPLPLPVQIPTMAQSPSDCDLSKHQYSLDHQFPADDPERLTDDTGTPSPVQAALPGTPIIDSSPLPVLIMQSPTVPMDLDQQPKPLSPSEEVQKIITDLLRRKAELELEYAAFRSRQEIMPQSIQPSVIILPKASVEMPIDQESLPHIPPITESLVQQPLSFDLPVPEDPPAVEIILQEPHQPPTLNVD